MREAVSPAHEPGKEAAIAGNRDAIEENPARAGSHRLFYGWIIAVAAAVVVFASGPGQSYGFSVFIDPLIADTGFSRTEISALYTIGTGISAVMVFMVGRLSDRWGPRIMLIAVTIGLGLACLGMAVAVGPLAFFLAFAALRALGQGSMPVNGTLLLAQWFVRYRGRAMAIMGLGGAASSAILPPMSQFLINAYGWRETYVILGIGVWLLVIPLAIFVVRNRPEERSLLPDGADEPPRSEQHDTEETSPIDEREESTHTLATVFFWVTAISVALPSVIVTAFVFHQISILTAFGLSDSAAAGIFVPFSIASAASGLASGYLADRFGPVRVFTANLGLLLAATIVLLLVSSPALALVYALLAGTFQGAHMITMNTIWAYFYGRHGLGRIQGAGQMIGITASAIGPLPLAALQGLFGSFVPAIAIIGSLSIVSAIAINLVQKQPHEAT